MLDIPFQEAFRHAQAERSSSDAIVVKVRGSDGSLGYGEALPRGYVTGETRTSVNAFLREAAPWVFAQSFDDPEAAWNELASYGLQQIHGGMSGSTGELNNAAFCALELALLDWIHRRAGKSIAERLPPRRSEIIYSGVVPAEDPAVAASLARRFVDAGIRQLKLKVGIGDDAARLAAVRRAVGNAAQLRVDANGAWEIEEAVQALNALKPFGIDCVEQPVSHQRPDHVAGLKFVREKTGIAVVADESLNTLVDARALADARACDYFNVRVSKNGGLTGAVAIAQVAIAAGISVQVGAQVGETAILTAAGRFLAAHMPDLAYAEGSFGTLLLSEDIASQDLRFGPGGAAPALTGPGLGIDVRQDVLERLAEETIVLRRED
jgi:muconate cycloisomerase